MQRFARATAVRALLIASLGLGAVAAAAEEGPGTAPGERPWPGWSRAPAFGPWPEPAYDPAGSGPGRGYGPGPQERGPAMGAGMGQGMGPGMGHGMGPGMGQDMGPGMGQGPMTDYPPIVDLNGDNGISDDEAAAYEEGLFLSLDANGDGKLIQAEFLALAGGGNLQEVSARFAATDSDGNGELSKAEFLKDAERRFKAMDVDKNGKVSPWEFRAAH